MALLSDREGPRQPADGAAQDVACNQQAEPGELIFCSVCSMYKLCPRQINRDSGIGWIAIKMTERSSKNLAAKEEWDKLEEEPTMETVNQIAAKHQVTGNLLSALTNSNF